MSLFIPTFLNLSSPGMREEWDLAVHFVDPIIAVEVDESRKILYTLSESSVIQVLRKTRAMTINCKGFLLGSYSGWKVRTKEFLPAENLRRCDAYCNPQSRYQHGS